MPAVLSCFALAAIASVAGAYRHRLPYPPAVFSILLGLIADAPAVVLDAGSGEGSLARGLQTAGTPYCCPLPSKDTTALVGATSDGAYMLGQAWKLAVDRGLKPRLDNHGASLLPG